MLSLSFHDIGDRPAALRLLMNALVLAADADKLSLAASNRYRLGQPSAASEG
jgi:hypothetical protein